MVGRLSSFVEAKPKRAVQMIVILVVASVVATTFAAAYALDLSSGPTYPSEVTPLSLVDGAVMWTQDWNINVNEGGGYRMTQDEEFGTSNLSYHDFSFYWRYHIMSSVALATFGTLVNSSELSLLSAGSRAVVIIPVGGYLAYVGDNQVEQVISLRITDVHGDGMFGIGDMIEFMDSGLAGGSLPEGCEFTVALAYVGAYVFDWRYHYAFEDGRFFAWRSAELNTEQPWWE